MSKAPTQSTCLPLKKRIFHCDKDTKLMSLDELKSQAFYNVLYAFSAEDSAISSSRIEIIHDLKEYWKFSDETHTAFKRTIEDDPEIKKLRKLSMDSLTATTTEGVALTSEADPQERLVRSRKRPQLYSAIDHRSLPCSFCEKLFDRQSNLTTHMRGDCGAAGRSRIFKFDKKPRSRS